MVDEIESKIVKKENLNCLQLSSIYEKLLSTLNELILSCKK